MIKTDLFESLDKYLNYLCFSGKYTPHTCLNYVSDLNQIFEQQIFGIFIYKPMKSLTFSKKAAKNGTKRTLDSFPDITDKLLTEVFNDFKPKLSKLSAVSRKRKISSFKGFSKWCFENEIITTDPGKSISSIKLPQRLPKYLNLDEIISYFQNLKADFKTDPHKYRNEWISFLFLYGCGLRIHEACQIQTSNVDLKQKRTLVFGKGKKERFAIMPEFMALAIKPHLDFAQNEQWTYIYGEKPLVTRTVFNWIRKRALKAGIHKPIHPHMFRHSYATHLLREHTDLRHLQELLGHSSLTSTQVYAHLDRDQLLQNLERFHPLSKK